MIITIHQPDFMPWYGFFNKISKVDTWVVLDHVHNNPRKAFWGRRVQILSNGKPLWLSIPLEKPPQEGQLGMPLNIMKINLQEKKNISKSLKTLEQSYSKSINFDKYFFLLTDYFLNEDNNLMTRNMRFITDVMDILSIKSNVIFSSSMGIQTTSTQLLVDILKANQASEYLCGQGADGYQDIELFKHNSIKLSFNQFEHPVYKQLNTEEFFQGLSIIDMLFNCDLDYVKEICT